MGHKHPCFYAKPISESIKLPKIPDSHTGLWDIDIGVS